VAGVTFRGVDKKYELEKMHVFEAATEERVGGNLPRLRE